MSALLTPLPTMTMAEENDTQKPSREAVDPASTGSERLSTPGLPALKFGLQWKTLSGNRAFCWSMFYDKTETLNVEGLVYNEKTQTWGGCISATASLALKNAVAGPAPNLPDLKRALCAEMNQLISREIEYTAWKRGAA